MSAPHVAPDHPSWRSRYLLEPSDRPATLPSIHSWTPASGVFSLDVDADIALITTDEDTLDVAALFADDLARFTGRRHRLEHGAEPRPGEVGLHHEPGTTEIPPEGYRLDVGDAVRVVASTRSGLLYGCQSLLQMIKQDEHRRHVPRGLGHDAPRFPVRGQMIDVGRKYLPLDYLRSEIRRMAWMKMNSLHLHLSEWNGFRFESLEHLGLASPEHYTQDELRALDAYAQRWGVTIVPEIDLPGHAVWLTRYEPRLRSPSTTQDFTGWPGGAGGGWTIDITSDFVRAFVRGLLAEVAQVFHGEFIHIGSDELPLQGTDSQDDFLVRYARAHKMTYAGDVLVDFINDMADSLRRYGKRVEIWEWWAYGDQPTSIAPAPDIRIDKWLTGDVAQWARHGYETVGVNWDGNFVTPGYATTPDGLSPHGFEGYMDSEAKYEQAHYPVADGLMGYRLGRWMDRAERYPTEWVHHFSHRPLQILAERLWGSPGAPSAAAFYERADAVGSAQDNLTAVPGHVCRIVSVSSEEIHAESGAAVNVLDPHPQTHWVTRYLPELDVPPHELVVDLGDVRPIAGLTVWPRQDGAVVERFHHAEGRARSVRLEVSTDLRQWDVAWSGTLPDHQAAAGVTFPPRPARYVRLTVVTDWQNLMIVAMSYITVWETPRT